MVVLVVVPPTIAHAAAPGLKAALTANSGGYKKITNSLQYPLYIHNKPYFLVLKHF
jgi:hypothetical protein